MDILAEDATSGVDLQLPELSVSVAVSVCLSLEVWCLFESSKRLLLFRSAASSIMASLFWEDAGRLLSVAVSVEELDILGTRQ